MYEKSVCLWLYRKYHQKIVDDWGSVNSPAMKQFAKDAKKTFKQIEGVKLEDFSLGHYSISGFFSGNGGYVYFSYDIPRGDNPIDMARIDPLEGILIRKASSTKDYTGGTNTFTNMMNFEYSLKDLLDMN